MNWALGTLLVLIIIFLSSSYSKKKKKAKLQKKLLKDWGSPKKEERFNFDSINKYFENNKHKASAFHIISDRTKADLDIDELFKFIDRTSSKIGQQYLYYKLRTIGHFNEFERFDSLIKIFEKDKNLSIACQTQLSKLDSKEVYDLEELFNGEGIKKPKTLWLSYVLALSVFLLILASFFVNPIYFLPLIPIYVVNLIFHYRNKNNLIYYLNGAKQLSTSLAVARRLSEYTQIKSFYKTFPFINKIGKIQFKTQFLTIEKNLHNEYAIFAWFLIENIKILFNFEVILFFSFIDSVIKEKDSIESMYTLIGEVDSAISAASLKSNVRFCTPHFVSTNKIEVSEISHPLILNCVPNDFDLQDRSLLITGSNMSGKTTFIRTVAINGILAQTLNLCFAKTYTAPFLKLFSSVRISDNLFDDTSYYLQEVLTIKELLEASLSEAPCLFVLDEVFKGTNTIERISGGQAILSYLNKGNNYVIVSTHDIELTELLEEENYELYHFTEKIENDTLTFDHKLKKGRLKTRNAIKILELYGYPEEIIASAKSTEKSISGLLISILVILLSQAICSQPSSSKSPSSSWSVS